ncbi:hypothetical protein G5B38_10185 [Pseudohalocynthiibacter aestuariivivens]|nr:hypothetical protein [Pseudohalocynthiibacter aestuariivivens]QIE45863.1 hypothetical protein G5B38_10185 [Pseudohalocynthiibacter aestuariivivens]
MRFLGCLLTICLLLTQPVSAEDPPRAQVSKADIVRLLGRIFTEETVQDDLVRLGFKGPNLALATTQMRRIMTDSDVAGYIADQVLAFSADGTLPGQAGAQGSLWGVIDRGVGHLPMRDLRYYYLVEQTVLNAMPTRDCGLAVKERLSPARLSDATARAAARLNTPALKQYYRIQLDAARFGATRPPVTMPAARMEQIEAKIFDALLARLAGAKNETSMIRTFARLDQADNRSACTAGRLFIDTVMNMKGRDQHDALVLLSMP